MSPNYYQSASRFEAIFEQSPFSIQLLSPEGRTLHVNPAWRRLWGMSDDFIAEVILKDYNLLEDPQLERNGILPYIRRGFAGEATEIPEILYDPKANGFEGVPCWISATIFPLKDDQGQVREVVLIHRDSTAAHEARIEQQRVRTMLELLANTTAVLHSSVDPEDLIGRFAESLVPAFSDSCIVDVLDRGQIRRLATVHAEPAKQRLYEELRDKFAPRPDSPQPSTRVMKTGQAELHRRLDPATIRKLAQNEAHAELAEKIGMRSILSVPLRVRGEVIGSINFVHTSDRRGFDDRDLLIGEELARRAAAAIDNAQLYRDTRVAVQQRDEFISIASHELKTPLTTLKLQAQLAMKRLESQPMTGLDRPYAESLVESLDRQLDRLTRLVEDMLDISRISTGKLSLRAEPVELSGVVGEVVERFRVQLAAAGIPLSYETTAAGPILGDHTRLDQVVTNLLTNAIRYGNQKPIHVSVGESGGNAVLRVKDEGSGIAPEDQARIFERFERASPVNLGGLGLGLYISREIVQSHGGNIRVDSEPGRGSVFTVEIPLLGPESTKSVV